MVIPEEEVPLEKIQISGPTLASILQLFSTSPGNIQGLLFGHVTTLTPTHFSDDTATSSLPKPVSTAILTSFISSPLPLPPSAKPIGWFSGRRRSPLRPSLRETESCPLSSSSCRVFLLMTSPTPIEERNTSDLIHTCNYKAYQFYSCGRFVPTSLEIVNIGPAFRGHYGSFSPISDFPAMNCEFRGLSSMAVDKDDNGEFSSSSSMAEDCGKSDDDGKKGGGMGLDVGRLSRLIGPQAVDYTTQLEGLYKGMLGRLDQLAKWLRIRRLGFSIRKITI